MSLPELPTSETPTNTETSAQSEREYSRGEDGRFTSTPQSKESGEAKAESTTSQSTAKESKLDAPNKPSFDEVARKEFDRIKAQHQSKETRTSAESTSPSPTSKSTTTPAPSTTQTAGVNTTAADKPSTQQPDNKLPDEYKDILSEDQHTILKRVGWLLPPEQLKAMGIEALADTLRAARAYRAEQDRSFQRQQQLNQSIPSESGNAPREVSGPQQPAAGQQAAGVRLPEVVETQLQSVAAEYGDDSPVYLAMRHNEEVRQLQFQQLMNQRQSDSMAMQNAMWTSAEDTAFTVLEKQFPKLKDSKERDELRTMARAHGKAMKDVGHAGLSPLQAIQFVSQARYFPEIQEQERKRLADNRERSLSQSVERGTATASPARSMSPDERDRRVYDELKKGKRRDAVMAEMRA